MVQVCSTVAGNCILVTRNHRLRDFDSFKIVLFCICKLKIAASASRIYLNQHFVI